MQKGWRVIITDRLTRFGECQETAESMMNMGTIKHYNFRQLFERSINKLR